jgi:hypothetical protein
MFKRKAEDKDHKVLPFNPGKPKTPLDVANGPKKFMNPFVKKKTKRRVKKERESDDDDDSSRPSGAEVKGDSDYVA